MLNDLLEHNRRWSEERLQVDPDYFQRLVAIQRPEYLWIGCSDSRVPANVITGLVMSLDHEQCINGPCSF